MPLSRYEWECILRHPDAVLTSMIACELAFPHERLLFVVTVVDGKPRIQGVHDEPPKPSA